MSNKGLSVCIFLCMFLHCYSCKGRIGPDPWDYIDEGDTDTKSGYDNVPPDLRIPIKKITQSELGRNLGIGEWFFKRTLAIVLKGGQTKVNEEDGSVDISLQMRFDNNRWEVLNGYIKSNIPLTEEMFRRSVGYVEEAIYKPTVVEKIAVAWSEYIQFYLAEYKEHITYTLGFFASVGLLFWLWKHISHKHMIIIVFVGLYLYEVVISYKEAEQKELERFVSAVNKCSWYFWKSTCEYPPPDPLIFLKHMNPLKIGIRMFTTLISEPFVTLSSTVNLMIAGVTDGLWFPFDKIIQGFLVLSINILLIFMLVMIIFNYLLNIPFNLSILGLFSFGVKQRNRTFNLNTNESHHQQSDNMNRISGAALDRLLEVCSKALNQSQNNQPTAITCTTTSSSNSSNMSRIKRSASTGRLPNSLECNDVPLFGSSLKVKQAAFMIGGGDGKGNVSCKQRT